MTDKELLFEFYETEKKFLLQNVDLSVILKAKGWEPVGEGTKWKKENQTLVIKAPENSNGNYVWYDYHLQKGGTAWDLVAKKYHEDLLARHAPDAKGKRNISYPELFKLGQARIKELRNFAFSTLPKEKLANFYTPYIDLINKEDQLVPNSEAEVKQIERIEAEFLLREISIVRLAEELGFKKVKEGTNQIIYSDGKQQIGFPKNRQGNQNLFKNHTTGVSGDTSKFLMELFSISRREALTRLKGYSKDYIPASRLQEFQQYQLQRRTEETEHYSSKKIDLSQRNLPSNRGIYRQLVNSLRNDGTITSWSRPESLLPALKSYYERPEQNKAFQQAAEVVGKDNAAELTRIALVEVISQKIQSTKVQSTLTRLGNDEVTNEIFTQVLKLQAQMASHSGRTLKGKTISKIAEQFGVSLKDQTMDLPLYPSGASNKKLSL